MMQYVLWEELVARGSDKTITTIPPGAVLDAPAKVPKAGTVRVVYQGQAVTVLALDLLHSARSTTGGVG